MLRNESGYTLMNLLTTLSLIAIFSATAVSNLKVLENPLADASFALTHFLRVVRADAMAQTIAIEVAPTSSTTIGTSTASSCDATMTPNTDLQLTLNDGVVLLDTTWSFCFTSRGLSDSNIVIDINEAERGTRSIEVALGGGTREL